MFNDGTNRTMANSRPGSMSVLILFVLLSLLPFLTVWHLRTMAPKFADRLIVVMEQGGTAQVLLDAANGTIDSMTKTAVIFSLHTGFLCRNG